MNPKVSIIVPCYNCELYIGDALESLIDQSYSNYEIICINDGSTDGTLSVLMKYERGSKGVIRIIDQDNQGVSEARNRGIQESKGEYIMFCDADDLYNNKMISILVNMIEKYNADTAYCLLSRNRDEVETNMPDNCSIQLKHQREMMLDLLYRMGEIGFYCFIYKTNIIKEEALEFEVQTKNFEDREFNWKYLANCKNGVYVESKLYWYRYTQNSATTKNVVEWKVDRLNAVRRIESYLKDRDNEFYSVLHPNLFARVIWSLAKNYSLSGQYQHLKRLEQEYGLSKYMRITMRDKNRKVAVLSKLYLISPVLFFCSIRIGAAFIRGEVYVSSRKLL